jgi:transcriptional regulator with XRE-family HTH domain
MGPGKEGGYMATRTPTPQAVAIGRRIRQARDAKVMSQTDLVNECRKHPETKKLAVETISRAERGLHVPRKRALRVLARVLDIPLAEFQDAETETAPDAVADAA